MRAGDHWEPWNESNNTGWGNAAAIRVEGARALLRRGQVGPSRAAASTVIGGSTIDVAYSWWQQLVAAGGLADLDVAAIHPYPGSNDSFEEDGKPAQIRQLESLLAGRSRSGSPRSAGGATATTTSSPRPTTVARAMLWMKALSVPVWGYFYDEGNWGNDGVSFSLIQAGNVDDYVKPAALAAMTTTNEVAIPAPDLGMPSTGIPQTVRGDLRAERDEQRPARRPSGPTDCPRPVR